MSYDREALLELIRTESLQRGEFTLASGKRRLITSIAGISHSTPKEPM